jgi:L,D-peptidoglycan transpeptidase YkuD (ErfK/YbiS/YcfS/YnhG family)
MDLIVTPDPRLPHIGTLTFGARTFVCVLGRSGVRIDKREGDGATPVGVFPLRRVLYRSDRLPPPQTRLPVAAIAPTDGWCDAPEDKAYNTQVTLPCAASAEQMFRDDGLYDVVVILGHNDAPVVPGAGSAIFLHVAPPHGQPTAGCIALPLPALLDLLRGVETNSSIRVLPPR